MDSHQKDLEILKFTYDDIKLLNIYFSIRKKIFFLNKLLNFIEIQNLARKLGLRQRVVASAIIYFRRFYIK